MYTVNKVFSQHADDSLLLQRKSFKSACSYILLILQTFHHIFIIYLQSRLSGKDFNSDTGQLITSITVQVCEFGEIMRHKKNK